MEIDNIFTGQRMVLKDKSHVTAAVRFLRMNGVNYSEHPYRYIEKGGTTTFARESGVDEHSVIKTLVMEDEGKRPMIVLMHGDREVSTKELARIIKVKKVDPCPAREAERHTGYLVGGISPFGTKKNLPVFMEETILEIPKVYINGGRRGFLVSIEPKEIVRILTPRLVKVAVIS